MSQELFGAMRQSIIDGDEDAAVRLASESLELGIDPLTAIDDGYVPGLDHVGDQFAIGEMFLPDMMLAARAMKGALAILEPEMKLRSSHRTVLGRVVIGTVKGDIHEIGKNLVGMMLTASGFEVHDLGVDVPFERFAEKAREVDADIVGVSALLTTTMTGQQNVLAELQAAGLRPRVKLMVGGAPVTGAWASEIGADGYSEDAVGAVTVAKRMMGIAATDA
jgi:corrinoid protein of di/trimethylamine methyltransferase